MLTPYANAPSASAPRTGDHAGSVSPRADANPMLTAAAMPVFTATIWNGSRTESRCVRLLSTAHPRHADPTRSTPSEIEVAAPALQSDQGGSRKDDEGTRPGPAAEVFMEDDDAHEQGERALEIQEE